MLVADDQPPHSEAMDIQGHVEEDRGDEIMAEGLQTNWENFPIESITVKIADLGNACWVGTYACS